MAYISGLVRLASTGSDPEVWPLFPFERLSQGGRTALCHGSFSAAPGSEAAESRVPVRLLSRRASWLRVPLLWMLSSAFLALGFHGVWTGFLLRDP